MRGVAALMVATYHLTEKWGFARQSYLAVDLFFLISGVVMASAYDDRINSGMAMTEFMRRRAIRLYPMYLAGVVGCLALGSFHGSATYVAITTSLFMIPSLDSPVLYPTMGVAWSLFFELAGNLLFVALHRNLTPLFLSVVVGISALTLVVLTVDVGMNQGPNWADWQVGLARLLFSFFGGVLIWRQRSRLSVSMRPLTILLAVAAVCLYSPKNSYLFDLIVVLTIWQMLVFAGINSNTKSNWMTVLGIISYPLYCIHVMFSRGVLQPQSPLGAACTLLLSIGLAWLAVRYYDAPVRAWLSRRTVTA